MVMSYIIIGKDGRVHVISPKKQITTAVLNKIKCYGLAEVAVRGSEKEPEKSAELIYVDSITPVSLGVTSVQSLTRKELCL